MSRIIIKYLDPIITSFVLIGVQYFRGKRRLKSDAMHPSITVKCTPTNPLFVGISSVRQRIRSIISATPPEQAHIASTNYELWYPAVVISAAFGNMHINAK